MPFGLWVPMGPRNRVLHGGPEIPVGRGNFGERVVRCNWLTGFSGYSNNRTSVQSCSSFSNRSRCLWWCTTSLTYIVWLNCDGNNSLRHLGLNEHVCTAVLVTERDRNVNVTCTVMVPINWPYFWSFLRFSCFHRTFWWKLLKGTACRRKL